MSQTYYKTPDNWRLFKKKLKLTPGCLPTPSMSCTALYITLDLKSKKVFQMSNLALCTQETMKNLPNIKNSCTDHREEIPKLSQPYMIKSD